MVSGYFSGVFHPGNPAILVSYNQVEVTIAIPIEHNWDNHLQIHGKSCSRCGLETLATGVPRITAGADVFKIGESVEKFATQQIQISIVIEIGEMRRRAAKGVDWCALRQNLEWGIVERRFGGPFVAKHKNKTVERSVSPFSLAVPSIVPAVVAPVFNSHNHVERTVAIVVD